METDHSASKSGLFLWPDMIPTPTSPYFRPAGPRVSTNWFRAFFSLWSSPCGHFGRALPSQEVLGPEGETETSPCISHF